MQKTKICKIKGLRLTSENAEKVANFELLTDLVSKLRQNCAMKVSVPQFTFQTQASSKEVKSYQFEKFLSNTANEKRFLLEKVSNFMTQPYGVTNPYNTNNLSQLHELALENGQKVL